MKCLKKPNKGYFEIDKTLFMVDSATLLLLLSLKHL